MFDWIRRKLGRKTPPSQTRKYEVKISKEQVLLDFLRDYTGAIEAKQMEQGFLAYLRAYPGAIEAKELVQILAILRAYTESPKEMGRLLTDFDLRSLKEDTGGSSSSPIS